MSSVKLCRRCKQTLPLDSFCKHKRNKDGHSDWCKDCARHYFVNRYHTDSEFRKKQIEYVNRYNLELDPEKRREYKRKAFRRYKRVHAEKIEASKKISLFLTETGVRDRLWERCHGCCEMCGLELNRDGQKHNYAIHHLDSNRLNNAEENLIVVCTKCHLHKLHPRPVKCIPNVCPKFNITL